MWSVSLPDDDDPLRQGDLLVGVTLPKLRPPIPFFSVYQQEVTTVPASTSNAIVISQCCDNVQNDYVAVAPIGLLGNLRDHHIQALLNPEPVWKGTSFSEYVLEHFRIEPISGILDDPGSSRYLVAKLHHSATFSGDCTPLLGSRRARMNVEARRLLRIKLGLLWSRAEAGDIEELKQLDLPPGLSEPLPHLTDST